MNQAQDYYNGNKTAYPNIKDCPEKTPYFDGYDCISCPEATPYFGMDSRNCQACPENTSYNVQAKECVKTKKNLVRTDPTIAKMYSSIF